MSHHNRQLRWTVAARWIAMLGFCLALGSGYVSFRPARAQDAQLPSPNGKSASGEGNAAAKSAPKSSADISKLAVADLNTVEPDKKNSSLVQEAATTSVLRDIQWLSPH